MKIVLSRKGFDSAAGGCPSPIFADDSLYSLPIPDPRSPYTYQQIKHANLNVADLVEQLTKGRITRNHGVHLDPDLDSLNLPRQVGWRPLFGQANSAQAHLTNQGLSVGDVFLFFGLFRRTTATNGLHSWGRQSTPQHLIWGWLQVAAVIDLNEKNALSTTWWHYHPHCHINAKENVLYVGAKFLKIDDLDTGLLGSGLCSRYHKARVLTAPSATSVSQWRLPAWFYPGETKPALTYHKDLSRWRRGGKYCYLSAACRGQEFVLDTDQYPQAKSWLMNTIKA